eukprot:TRINITY_DN46391_c1_g1_i2.p1 TRINITY_DN46391_c1_g1~~TRINITY_DN46391_c1_g1_i2.p1  ORF type:complete len:1039 (+),score=333.39 TRINITY_DN46391_c1_g1_i2:103-3117(+)
MHHALSGSSKSLLSRSRRRVGSFRIRPGASSSSSPVPFSSSSPSSSSLLSVSDLQRAERSRMLREGLMKLQGLLSTYDQYNASFSEDEDEVGEAFPTEERLGLGRGGRRKDDDDLHDASFRRRLEDSMGDRDEASFALIRPISDPSSPENAGYFDVGGDVGEDEMDFEDDFTFEEEGNGDMEWVSRMVEQKKLSASRLRTLCKKLIGMVQEQVKDRRRELSVREEGEKAMIAMIQKMKGEIASMQKEDDCRDLEESLINLRDENVELADELQKARHQVLNYKRMQSEDDGMKVARDAMDECERMRVDYEKRIHAMESEKQTLLSQMKRIESKSMIDASRLRDADDDDDADADDADDDENGDMSQGRSGNDTEVFVAEMEKMRKRIEELEDEVSQMESRSGNQQFADETNTHLQSQIEDLQKKLQSANEINEDQKIKLLKMEKETKTLHARIQSLENEKKMLAQDMERRQESHQKSPQEAKTNSREGSKRPSEERLPPSSVAAKETGEVSSGTLSKHINEIQHMLDEEWRIVERHVYEFIEGVMTRLGGTIEDIEYVILPDDHPGRNSGRKERFSRMDKSQWQRDPNLAPYVKLAEHMCIQSDGLVKAIHWVTKPAVLDGDRWRKAAGGIQTAGSQEKLHAVQTKGRRRSQIELEEDITKQRKEVDRLFDEDERLRKEQAKLTLEAIHQRRRLSSVREKMTNLTVEESFRETLTRMEERHERAMKQWEAKRSAILTTRQHNLELAMSAMHVLLESEEMLSKVKHDVSHVKRTRGERGGAVSMSSKNTVIKGSKERKRIKDIDGISAWEGYSDSEFETSTEESPSKAQGRSRKASIDWTMGKVSLMDDTFSLFKLKGKGLLPPLHSSPSSGIGIGTASSSCGACESGEDPTRSAFQRLHTPDRKRGKRSESRSITSIMHKKDATKVSDDPSFVSFVHSLSSGGASSLERRSRRSKKKRRESKTNILITQDTPRADTIGVYGLEEASPLTVHDIQSILGDARFIQSR